MPKLREIILVLLFIGIANAWDSDDLEIFDLVEEVGKNFYDLLEVKENADASSIRKAFRKLSVVLHPDKNSAPDANIKFRQLVAVYDILRDSSKRAKYDDVLIHGLPDWKEAVYYYRKVRKMGLIEMSVILFIIITIGQYLVAWAAYFEKKYAIEEFVSIKSKKIQKKQKKGKAVDQETVQILPELVAAIPKPTIHCTLPVQICKLVWFLIVDAPPLTYHFFRRLYEERKRAREQVAEESSSEEEIIPVRERGPRRRKGFQMPEVKESDRSPQEGARNASVKPKVEQSSKLISGGIWTDDDLIELMRLMKKFPQGTQERWHKIGDAMNRPVNEVAHMAHKLKDEAFMPMPKQEEEKKEEEPKKVKTKGKLGEDVEEGVWSQLQQKAFEQALITNPKGSGAGDRWEKISRMVPGKTKEECMLRYKNIVDRLKKKKTEGETDVPKNAKEKPSKTVVNVEVNIEISN